MEKEGSGTSHKKKRNLWTVEETENWRAMIKKERMRADEAEKKWGYMYGDFHRHLPEEDRKKHEEYLAKIRKEPEVKTLVTGARVDQLIIGMNKSPPVPQTTSGQIGWRSGPEYKIIMNDVHDSKHYQHDLVKTLKWPLEGCI